MWLGMCHVKLTHLSNLDVLRSAGNPNNLLCDVIASHCEDIISLKNINALCHWN